MQYTSRTTFDFRPGVVRAVALVCAIVLVPGNTFLLAQSVQKPAPATPAQPPPATPAQPGQKPAQPGEKPAAPAVKIPNDQLDSLVAPIALYPDPLLAQTLAASTYPLEIVQLQQWLAKNKNLKDKALTDAAMKQPWDPSIQAMAVLPDVVDRLANDIQWTTDLGNAFLAQQSDVMDAVQRMRKKAQDKGALVTNEQQKVETKVVEEKTVIVVEPANPQVVYVPTYSPTVVWGPPLYYPYPPIYYPPYGYGAFWGGMIGFGVGIAVGAAWGGGWGWGCGWGGNNIDINVNNNFNRNTNINRNTNVSNRGGAGTSNRWSHDSSHRGGAPYSDRATADRFGGTARGDSLSSRQSTAQQRAGSGATRQQASPRSSSTAGSGAARSTASAGSGARSTAASGGGGDRVGSRSVSPSSSSSNRGAFGGASSGGGSTRASSSRGARSSGMSRGGGGRR